ncbi:MAG: lasso peptide biosynthesis B2 protein [Verrucomicrobia bacterium]|nr:lasso peptide biosynthesis B2 protein [Verrucomicrobiota bacterium]
MRGLVGVLHKAADAYRKMGLPALALVAEGPPHEVTNGDALAQALAQADALAAVLRVAPFRYCMRRAILRYHLLRAAGRAAVLVIGVERTASATGLDGHAWVEVDGLPFREEDDRPLKLTVVYRHPGAEPTSLHS